MMQAGPVNFRTPAPALALVRAPAAQGRESLRSRVGRDGHHYAAGYSIFAFIDGRRIDPRFNPNYTVVASHRNGTCTSRDFTGIKIGLSQIQQFGHLAVIRLDRFDAEWPATAGYPIPDCEIVGVELCAVTCP